MDGVMNFDQQMLNSQGFAPVSFGHDNNLNVSFYVKSVLNRAKSREAGRPVNESIEYVRIQHPGEKDYIDRPVSEVPETRNRFAAQWMAFKESRKFVPDGTPVEMVFPQFPEIAANLHGVGVHTAEQLANLTAEGISRLGLGGQDWVNRAKQFVDTANKGVNFHKLSRELADRDSKIDVLENTVAMLKNQLDRLLAERSGVPAPMIPANRPNQAQAWTQTLPDEPEPDFAPEPTEPIATDDLNPSFGSTVDLGSAEFQQPAHVQKRRPGRPPKNTTTN